MNISGLQSYVRNLDVVETYGMMLLRFTDNCVDSFVRGALHEKHYILFRENSIEKQPVAFYFYYVNLFFLVCSLPLLLYVCVLYLVVDLPFRNFTI